MKESIFTGNHIYAEIKRVEKEIEDYRKATLELNNVNHAESLKFLRKLRDEKMAELKILLSMEYVVKRGNYENQIKNQSI